MRRLLGFLAAGLFIVSTSTAQPEQGQRTPSLRRSIFYEAITFLGGRPGTVRVDVHYRIDADFFVAVRNTDPAFGHEFRRMGEVSIELRDSTGMARARAIQQVDLADDLSERPETQVRWHQGIASMEVAPGRYNVHLEASDRESRRDLIEKRLVVDAREPLAASRQSTIPFWIHDTTADATVAPLNFGGDVLLNRAQAIVFQIPATVNPPATATGNYTFTRTPKDIPSEDIRGVAAGKILTGQSLIAHSGGDSIWYQFVRDTTARALTVVLPLPTEKLLLRAYELTANVYLDTQTVEIKLPARIIWPDMPHSLKDVDYAIEALCYITTDQKLDSLRDGDFETRVRNLEQFWAAMDRKSASPYNQEMTEYYRRVDHAQSAFGTLRRPDGFRSDRGRIYVLYGPPTETQRELDPEAGFREVWKYQRLNKTFVFTDRARSGDYVLLQGGK